MSTAINTTPLFEIDVPPQVAELNASAELRRTRCGDGDVVWRIWGEGPAVVLFHGNYGSWTHWLKTIPVLARQYKVIAVDIPGFGESALPPEPYSIDSMASFLSEGLEKILPAADPIIFCGFSFGCMMAAGCARILRDRARKVVLVSGGSLVRGVREPAPTVGWRNLTSQEERDLAHRRNLEAVMIYDPAKVDDLAVRLQRNNAQQARLRGSKLGRRPMVDILTEAGREVCGVYGGNDVRCTPYLKEIYESMSALTPDPKFVLIPGAGHWLSYEAPDRLNKALLALLGDGEQPLFANGRNVVL